MFERTWFEKLKSSEYVPHFDITVEKIVFKTISTGRYKKKLKSWEELTCGCSLVKGNQKKHKCAALMNYAHDSRHIMREDMKNTMVADNFKDFF